MIENLLSLFIVQWRRESPIQTLSYSIDSKQQQQQNNVGQFIMCTHTQLPNIIIIEYEP